MCRIREAGTASCEIFPLDDPVDEGILERDSREYDFELDGWVRWDMPSEDYYDVFENREAYHVDLTLLANTMDRSCDKP